MYKNAVIRFFDRCPALLRAKESFIREYANKEGNALMVQFCETEQMAKEMVKIASKNWNGEYTII